MNNTIDRRNFLKITGAAIIGGALVGVAAEGKTETGLIDEEIENYGTELVERFDRKTEQGKREWIKSLADFPNKDAAKPLFSTPKDADFANSVIKETQAYFRRRMEVK